MITVEEIKKLLADVQAEHPTPWRLSDPDYQPRDKNDPDPSDVVDCDGERVVERDSGVYEPHGRTLEFITDAPMICAKLLLELFYAQRRIAELEAVVWHLTMNDAERWALAASMLMNGEIR